MLIENFKLIKQKKGSLLISNFEDLHFAVKRAFFIFDVRENEKRGEHAHYKTQQIIFLIKGTCSVELNNGKQTSKFSLSEGQAVLKEKLVWITLKDFTKDCVVGVYADTEYDERDYVDDFSKFLALTDGK